MPSLLRFIRKFLPELKITWRRARGKRVSIFDEKYMGRRRQTKRFLEQKDIDRSIRREWIAEVEKSKEAMIKAVMDEKGIAREDAIRFLKNGKFAARGRFKQGKVNYALEYRFKYGKFLWSSTRRESD